jgi:hypothetical protein
MRRSGKDLLELKEARAALDRMKDFELTRLAIVVDDVTPNGTSRLALVNALMMRYGLGWRYRDGWFEVRGQTFTRDDFDCPVGGLPL